MADRQAFQSIDSRLIIGPLNDFLDHLHNLYPKEGEVGTGGTLEGWHTRERNKRKLREQAQLKQSLAGLLMDLIMCQTQCLCSQPCL